MTAKEAAKKTTHAARGLWKWVTVRSAGLAIGGGAIAVLIGRYAENLDVATIGGWVAVGIGFAKDVIERTAKKTGGEVTNQVFERLGSHQAQIEQGAREHAACMVEHEDHKTQIAGLRKDVDSIATAVGELKPGWRLG